jgi:hypothetical protein
MGKRGYGNVRSALQAGCRVRHKKSPGVVPPGEFGYGFDAESHCVEARSSSAQGSIRSIRSAASIKIVCGRCPKVTLRFTAIRRASWNKHAVT